jgi:hypothetical protein
MKVGTSDVNSLLCCCRKAGNLNKGRVPNDFRSNVQFADDTGTIRNHWWPATQFLSFRERARERYWRERDLSRSIAQKLLTLPRRAHQPHLRRSD